jgi:hypothetical protein
MERQHVLSRRTAWYHRVRVLQRDEFALEAVTEVLRDEVAPLGIGALGGVVGVDDGLHLGQWHIESSETMDHLCGRDLVERRNVRTLRCVRVANSPMVRKVTGAGRVLR